MGWDANRILDMFDNPFHPALNSLGDLYGKSGIQSRVTKILRSMGVFQFEGYVRDDPVPEAEEPDLIELSTPSSRMADCTSAAAVNVGADQPEGGSHAQYV
jgi:hypothetical protein